jgi:hypothetical protein
MVVPKDPLPCQVKSPSLQIGKERARITDTAESKTRAGNATAQNFLGLANAVLAKAE